MKQDVYVAGCASTAEELQFLLPHGQVVLLGESLADANALEMLHKIRDVRPQTKVLVFGIKEQLDKIIGYIEAGAVGYILQDESIQDMVQKLQAAQVNQAIISPAVAAAMMNRLNMFGDLERPFAFPERKDAQLKELTLREREIAALLQKGNTNKEIARELVIECGTVKNHVHSILKKLKAANRHEAASVFRFMSPSPYDYLEEGR
jgi:DNA-binding NarL/FixJ family response regulator